MREEAIRIEKEKRDSDNGMLTDEFFRTVWKAPKKEEAPEKDAEKTESDESVGKGENAENSDENADNKEE